MGGSQGPKPGRRPCQPKSVLIYSIVASQSPNLVNRLPPERCLPKRCYQSKVQFFLRFRSLLRSTRKWLKNREGCKFFSRCSDTTNYAPGRLKECGFSEVIVLFSLDLSVLATLRLCVYSCTSALEPLGKRKAAKPQDAKVRTTSPGLGERPFFENRVRDARKQGVLRCGRGECDSKNRFVTGRVHRFLLWRLFLR